ncbi:hypothetical protein OY671_006685 [Metschnikowia pulcherrima]|nr:hypothetical protein OY671_006685 [Metschnikowia pulcherrima]
MNSTPAPKRDLQKIEQDLLVHKSVSSALRDLGTHLRDEEIRSCEAARNLIPLVVTFFKKEPFETLRVLINYSADNSENRRFLLSNEPVLDKFWTQFVATDPVEINHDEGEEGEEEQGRMLSFVKQFIFSAEDEEKKEFLAKLYEKNVVSWVFEVYSTFQETHDGRNEIGEPLEFLVEYSRYLPEKVTRSEFYNITGGFMNSVDPDSGEKDTDSFLAHAEFLFNCTNVPDSNQNFPVETMTELFIEVSQDDNHAVDILRKLFATCGNIYSFPSYDNWQDMPRKVGDVAGPWSFLIATGAISLGNCVSSKQTQVKLISQINQIRPIDEVARNLFCHKFEDVVYYQAYHFFNNVMTRDIAVKLFSRENASDFFHNTKVIVDNFAYYKEVGFLYMKFLRKLVTMAVLEGGADAMVFHAAWSYLLNIDESAEVLSLLLQAFAKTHDISNSLQEPILHKMLSLGETVDINTLLQKITAVAVFFNSYTITEIIKIHDDLFERTFLPQMESFLRQLEQALDGGSPAGNGAAQSTFENNARFLALMVQEKLQTIEVQYGAAVTAICGITSRMVSGAKN